MEGYGTWGSVVVTAIHGNGQQSRVIERRTKI